MGLEREIVITRKINRLFNIHGFVTVDMKMQQEDGSLTLNRVFIDTLRDGNVANNIGVHVGNDLWYYFPN